MGIKHLWSVLSPFSERKPLYELQGKTVAVDLSCWICEAQNITEYQVQPRMYLRNLFFRTCYLLLMEVIPVFVLEGKAPELKYQTIAARNKIQFKGARPKKENVKTGNGRTRFQFIQRQCEEMLICMGLACISGKGEAESLCAYLNESGLVDGCISEDSDCFAYGARVVYRNFSISTQGAYAANGGAVDVYDINKANQSLKFGRQKIVAMALLCGSDYNAGVQGVGKESILKLFENLKDEETLERLRSWRTNSKKYEEFKELISNKLICVSCGHHGKSSTHTKNGCNPCGTTKGCDSFRFKEERLRIKNELTIRKKALQDPDFPQEELVKEYLIKKDNMSELNLKWKQPNMANFIRFATKFLQWEELYAFEKILPIQTRWQCLNYDLIQVDTKGIFYPDRIKKIRNRKGVPSYEIIWSDPDNSLESLVTQKQLVEHDTNLDKLSSTIEPQALINQAYPELVENYKQCKINAKIKVGKRRQKDLTTDVIRDSSTNTLNSEPAVKKIKILRTNRKKITNHENAVYKKVSTKDLHEKVEPLIELENSFNELSIDKPKFKTVTLDSFLKTALVNSQIAKNEARDLTHNDNLTIIEEKNSNNEENKNCSFDKYKSDFSDEEDLDLSNIVENIVSRRQSHYIKKNFKKLNSYTSKDYLDTNFNKHHIKIDDLNCSSFFITNPVEHDLFEISLNMNEDNDQSDSTEEFVPDEENLLIKSEKNNRATCNKFTLNTKENKECEDSFCNSNYIPLLERLKMK